MKTFNISEDLANEFEAVRLGLVGACNIGWSTEGVHTQENHTCGRTEKHDGRCVCGYVLCLVHGGSRPA